MAAGGLGAPRVRQQHHPGALIHKEFGDGFSDAHRSAGYHNHFSRNTNLAGAHLLIFPFCFCDLCGNFAAFAVRIV
jgi:hypothetical protein